MTSHFSSRNHQQYALIANKIPTFTSKARLSSLQSVKNNAVMIDKT